MIFGNIGKFFCCSTLKSMRLILQELKESFGGLTQNDDSTLARHVSLPKAIARHVPNELMTEEEWRSLGVKQSQGWEHYMIHSKLQDGLGRHLFNHDERAVEG